MADAAAPAAPKTSLKDKVTADLKTAETDVESWFSWAMSYIPAGWQKYVAIVVVVLIAWHYFDVLWGLVPAKETVTPATMSDLSGKADKTQVASRLEAQTSALAQFMVDEKTLVNGLAAQSVEIDDLKTKVDAMADTITSIMQKKTASRLTTSSIVKKARVPDPQE